MVGYIFYYLITTHHKIQKTTVCRPFPIGIFHEFMNDLFVTGHGHTEARWRGKHIEHYRSLLWSTQNDFSWNILQRSANFMGPWSEGPIAATKPRSKVFVTAIIYFNELLHFWATYTIVFGNQQDCTCISIRLPWRRLRVIFVLPKRHIVKHHNYFTIIKAICIYLAC